MLIFLPPAAGETIALCLVPPNWDVRPKLKPSLPTDVQRSLSAKESRRRLAQSARYTFTYTGWLLTTRAAQDFRLGLARLKDETVGVPLWTDGVELAGVIQPGAATVFPAAGQVPARAGRDWLLVHPANPETAEIVQVSAYDAGIIHLTGAGPALQWPVGTMLYPLLFGRFERRPQLKADTDETADVEISVMETSAYGRRLTTSATAAAPTAGAVVPDFPTMPLWTTRPDFVSPVETTEADILYARLGFLREEQVYAQPQAVRRVHELTFDFLNRAQIAAVERFFVTQGGPTRPFLLPSFLGDLRLAANVPAGATQLTVEPSNYSAPGYSLAHPGAPFLALVDGARIQPVRVSLVVADTLTLQVAQPGGTWSMGATNLCHLLLVRFAQTELEWSYDGDNDASCTVRFLEVPGEYAESGAILPEPAFLYEFATALPNGSAVAWNYTSYEAPVVVGGVTYQPAPFSHGDVQSTLRLDQEQLTVSSFRFPGNPLMLLLPYALEAPLVLRIREANAADLTQAPVTLFSGEVQDLTPKGREITAKVLAFGRVFERSFPRVLVGPFCAKMQYGRPCGLHVADWIVTGTFTSTANAAGTMLNLTAPAAEAAERFAGGWIEFGAGTAYQSRTILHSTAAGGAGAAFSVAIGRPFSPAPAAGTAVRLVPSCGNTAEGCQAFNNFGRYLGFNFVPAQSPGLQAVPSANPSGGKGGGSK